MKTSIHHPVARFVVVFLLALALLPASVAASPNGHQGPAFIEQEVAANRLSYPVIWATGTTTGGLPASSAASDTSGLTVPSLYTTGYTEPGGTVIAATAWYEQKTVNYWQAQTATIDQPAVTLVSWGDNLLQDWRVGAKIRVETVFFVSGTGMSGFQMGWLTGEGITEVWGTNGVILTTQDATVYSPGVSMTIFQTKDADGNVLATPKLITGGYSATYSAEINVQGKVIYGGQWDTSNLDGGTYEIQLSGLGEMDLSGAGVNHGTTTTHEVALGGSGGSGGGGGGGGGGEPPDDPGGGGGGGGGEPTLPDIDGDGYANMDDNCVDVYNEDQANWDGDEAGDVCDDSDLDALTDYEEMNAGVDGYVTDPTKLDTDGDLLSDGDEVLVYGTNPTLADTDGDGYSDSAELAAGTDPRDPADNPGVLPPTEPPLILDADFDGVADAQDNCPGLANGNQKDTDGDGVGDACDPTPRGDEKPGVGNNPDVTDADMDGLLDADEGKRFKTDPAKWDSDGDGLGDGEEVNQYGTKPNKADTDGDGLNDFEEVKPGLDGVTTDPLKKNK